MHPSLDPQNRKSPKKSANKTPHIYTPWNIAGDSEHSQQAAFFCWANFASKYGYEAAAKEQAYIDVAAFTAAHGQPPVVPPQYPVPVLAWLHAIPNGGLRMPATSAMLKAEGAKTGVPDVFFPVPRVNCHGLYLEFKREMYRNRKNGGQSDEQVQWAAYLRSTDYRVEVVYNWIEAANVVTSYLST